MTLSDALEVAISEIGLAAENDALYEENASEAARVLAAFREKLPELTDVAGQMELLERVNREVKQYTGYVPLLKYAARIRAALEGNDG